MKTLSYNPSKLEIDFANAITSLKVELEAKLEGISIQEISANTKKDNPEVTIEFTDADGDAHTIQLNVIQRPDRVQ